MVARPDPAARARALAAALERDLADAMAVAVEARRALESTDGRTPADLEVYGAGKVAHDFYLAVENLLKRVVRTLDGAEPTGEAWHRDLLRQAATPVQGLRPAVLSPDREADLGELLRFRHRFRNLYAMNLDWPLVRDRLLEATVLADDLEGEVQAFVSFLRRLADAG